MNIENLTKACDSFEVFFHDLREAHGDAVISAHLLEDALFGLVKEALKLQVKLEVVRHAATYKEPTSPRKSI